MKFKVIGKQVSASAEVDVEYDKPIVIAGLNSTLKSVIAKSIAYNIVKKCVCGGNLDECLREKDLEYLAEFMNLENLKPLENLVDVEIDTCPNIANPIGVILEDYRLVTRYIIAFVLNHIKKMFEGLSNLSNLIEKKEDRKMYLSTVESEINHLKQLINPLPRIAFKLKTMILNDKLCKNLSILDSVVNNAYEEFKDEITPKDILPLSVDVVDEDRIYVRDKRVDRVVEVSSVSSAIAAALQFLVVTYLFATPHESRVLVIEEPEESMSPIQQVVFMRYLRELIKYYGGINAVLITTHSPYIAFATESRNYLAKYDHVNGLFALLPSEVPRSFIYGDVLLVPR
jgi:hypothetical protein